MTGSPLELERNCAFLAAAFSEGRRSGARLMSGEHRWFAMNDVRTVVSVPYPALHAGWTLRTLSCGIALQCSPSKDRVALFPLAELTERERRALTIVEGQVALGWIAAHWPGLVPELARLLPGLEPLDPNLEGPAMFERMFALARSNAELFYDDVLGMLPEGVPARGGVVGSIVRMAGRMPWSVRHKRVLPPGFDSTPVAGESNIRNPNLPPPSRPEDEDLIVRVDQRPGLPYPEWNLWTKAFLKDHVAVLERKLLPGSSVAKASHADLRRYFEQQTHRLMKRRLEDGCDLDLDAYIEHHLDTLTGASSEARVFRDLLPGMRDVATALLLDGSASLGSAQGHIFKLELACADALCQAMARARERHGLFLFNGKTRHAVRVNCLKDFADARLVMPSDLGLATGGYTRLGAPLRHLTRRLLDQPAERRLLIVIGDGMISDEGYEGKYAWADSAHAVEEATEAGVSVHYVGVGRARVDPLPEVFGPKRSTRIVRVEELPRVLSRVHRELVAA
ncbi:MAG: VWA domain-containing protein [Polyangiales bacterium]